MRSSSGGWVDIHSKTEALRPLAKKRWLASSAFGFSPDPRPRPPAGHEEAVVPQTDQPLVKIEEAYIKLILDHVGGNRKRAAEILGISLRTLQNRIVALREDADAAVQGK